MMTEVKTNCEMCHSCEITMDVDMMTLVEMESGDEYICNDCAEEAEANG